MSGIIQIRGEVRSGQHDALIEFLAEYSKRNANQLLLKVCESLIKTDRPKLALFSNFPEEMLKNSTKRVVYLKLCPKTHPLLTDFYRCVPYGSRKLVLINLLNHYMQLVEANRSLLDLVYWGTQSDEVVSAHVQNVSALPLPIVEYESSVARKITERAEPEPQASVEEIEIDPLDGFRVDF